MAKNSTFGFLSNRALLNPHEPSFLLTLWACLQRWQAANTVHIIPLPLVTNVCQTMVIMALKPCERVAWCERCADSGRKLPRTQ
jgi:hypothetical protein